jgi:lactoylglutathione lyase
MFREMFPIITVRNLDRALEFYRDALGGEVSYSFPPEGEGDPVNVTLRLADTQLGLGVDPNFTGPAVQSMELCTYTDDCDAAVAHLRAAGAKVLEEPADQPWGERMAWVADPDGYRLMILSVG